MKTIVKLAACAAAATVLAGCGDGRGPDGLTAEERRKLDEYANSTDNISFDTSPDSLVANEEALEEEIGDAPPPANAAGTANAQ